MIRTTPGHFLAPGWGYRTQPLREYPPAADERELVERIRAATTIRDEPEMVGPRWLIDYAQVALLHRSQQHALDVAAARQTRPRLDPADRIRDIRRRAKHAHVDVSHELRIMHDDLTRAATRGRPTPPRVLERIEGLEALFDAIR